MLTPVHDSSELCVVVLVGYERECLEHRFDLVTGAAGLVPYLDELFQVARDLTFVPRDQNALDVREVLVEVARPMPVCSAI